MQTVEFGVQFGLAFVRGFRPFVEELQFLGGSQLQLAAQFHQTLVALRVVFHQLEDVLVLFQNECLQDADFLAL